MRGTVNLTAFTFRLYETFVFNPRIGYPYYVPNGTFVLTIGLVTHISPLDGTLEKVFNEPSLWG